MSQPRLRTDFQPCTTDGRTGVETISHSGRPIELDITAYVVGMGADELRSLHSEASRYPGKDLDFVAEALPGLVEAHAGSGGYDVTLDGDDIADFLEQHGLDVATLTDADLERLRTVYGTEPGAVPEYDGGGDYRIGMR